MKKAAYLLARNFRVRKQEHRFQVLLSSLWKYLEEFQVCLYTLYMRVFISMHLGYSLRNPSFLSTENLIQVSEFLLGKGKQYMKYILAFICYRFRDRSSCFKCSLRCLPLKCSCSLTFYFWACFGYSSSVTLPLIYSGQKSQDFFLLSKPVGFLNALSSTSFFSLTFFKGGQLLLFPTNCTLVSSLHTHSGSVSCSQLLYSV